MSPEAITRIRNQRAFNVPWSTIARDEGRTVEECRAAIGMPTYKAAEPQPAPWVARQQLLFDQPEMDRVSDR